MGDTDISWCHRPGTRARSWNPGQGCSLKSEGCRNCYAMRMAARFAENGWSKGLINLKTGKWNGVVRIATHKLDEPLRWRDPSTVFVNSMTDMFHENYSNEQIAAVFGIMAACPQHTFQMLTKRADRMREWFDWARDQAWDDGDAVHDYRLMLGGYAGSELGDGSSQDEEDQQNRIEELIADAWARDGADGGTTWECPWPLPNVWLGTSVENQEAADERIPELLRTPAAIRFLSCEPLLGPIDLRPYLSKGDHLTCPRCRFASNAPTATCPNDGARMVPDFGIDWVIAGCESGHGARDCDVAWIRSIVEHCRAAGVPPFVKQAFGWDEGQDSIVPMGIGFGPGSDNKGLAFGGRRVIERPYLDGRQILEFPEVELKELIAKSSIGAGLADIKERGIDAHLETLDAETKPKRRRKR